MNKKTIGIILISCISVILIGLLLYFIYSKNKRVEFYAKVTESFASSSIVEPLESEKISADYPVVQITIGNLKKGDLIKVSAEKKFIEDYPPVAKVIDYEFIINSTTSVTEFPKTTSEYISKNDEEVIPVTSKNVTSNKIATTSKVSNKPNNKTTTKSADNIYSTTTKISTTKVYTTTNNNVNLSSKDSLVINNLKSKINSIESKKSDKSFGETAKEYFISGVDFIFYDKDIKGVYFKDLTSTAKLKAISLVLKLDNLVDKYYPGYKDDLSNSYTNAKSKLIELYLDKTTEYCANNDTVCKQAKSDFQDMKTSLNITWDIIKTLGNKGISKLKDWYEIYSGK